MASPIGPPIKLIKLPVSKPTAVPTERKEIRSMLRLMRDNYERGLYEGVNTSIGRRSTA
jgi:hypothetical protein